MGLHGGQVGSMGERVRRAGEVCKEEWGGSKQGLQGSKQCPWVDQDGRQSPWGVGGSGRVGWEQRGLTESMGELSLSPGLGALFSLPTPTSPDKQSPLDKPTSTVLPAPPPTLTYFLGS